MSMMLGREARTHANMYITMNPTSMNSRFRMKMIAYRSLARQLVSHKKEGFRNHLETIRRADHGERDDRNSCFTGGHDDDQVDELY